MRREPDVGLRPHPPKIRTPYRPARAARSLAAPRLGIVATTTERLPVCPVPEPRHVAAVRDDVIDDRRSGDAALAFADEAERVLAEEAHARPLPPPRVAPRVTRRPCRVGLCPSRRLRLHDKVLVRCARSASPHEGATARLGTGAQWCRRHHATPRLASPASSTPHVLSLSLANVSRVLNRWPHSSQHRRRQIPSTVRRPRVASTWLACPPHPGQVTRSSARG